MKTLAALAVVLLLTAGPAVGQPNGSQVYLDHVDGLVNGSIQVGSGGVTFHIGCLNGDLINPVRGLSNGFRIYGSDSSVTWDVLDYGPQPEIIIFFDQYSVFVPPDWNGVGADTIGFSSSVLFGEGLPPGYDGPYFWITVALTGPEDGGGTFCLDSSWFPPSGNWIWAYGSSVGSFAPGWDGPHCWEVLGPCCVGIRGNVDADPEDLINIADLVHLVDYMFASGPEPPCWEEADIDGSGGNVLDVSDMVYLVDYMFSDGPPPAACP